MKKSVRKSILHIKPYVPGRPIEEVKRELGLKNVIKLASNENPYGPSPKVQKAIATSAQTLNRYPDADCYYLRRELSKKLNLQPSQLVFGNGSDELIVLAIKTLVNVGDEVVIAKPSFLIYDIASRIAGAQIKAIPLKSFCYDLAAMKKAVTKKTKIIFLGNPDNPAGTYFTQTQIEKFMKGLRKDILVFLDEAYYEYVDKNDYVDSIGLLKKYKNILVTRTFSKMYGLAGLRVGYGVGNSQFVDYLNRIREPFNVNSLAQVAAVACLKDQKYYRKIAKTFSQQRVVLNKALNDLGLKTFESFTNFILVKVNGSSTMFCNNLLKKGVIVRDMSFWGMNDMIRVSIGTEKENQRFIKVVKEIL